jgi:hypothetical protein
MQPLSLHSFTVKSPIFCECNNNNDNNKNNDYNTTTTNNNNNNNNKRDIYNAPCSTFKVAEQSIPL